METIGDRVRWIRTEVAKQSQAVFARNLGVSQSALSYIEKNEGKPGSDFLFALKRYSGYSIDWLLEGGAPVMAHEAIDMDNRRENRLPLYLAPVPAGELQTVQTRALELVSTSELLLPERPDTAIICQAMGDELTGLGIEPGDYLVADTEAEPTAGEIALCELNGARILRRLAGTELDRWLFAANPVYEAIQVQPTDNFRILGIVIRMVRMTAPKYRTARDGSGKVAKT